MSQSSTTELLTPELKACIGQSMPPVHVEVTRRDLRKYAVSTGQRAKKHLDGDEAPPLFHFGYAMEILPLEELRNDGIAGDKLIPELPLKRLMAGSSDTVYQRPIRCGDKLVITRRLKDLYEKQGKTGPLIFVVTETVVETEAGESVLSETTSLIAR